MDANSGKLKIYLVGAVVVLLAIAGTRAYISHEYSKKCGVPRASCKEHQLAGCESNSVYPIALANGTSFKAYCDQKTDQGGWMLVLNYSHHGGTNPPLNARKTDLPLSSDAGLGTDESGTENWGHAAPAMMGKIEFTEMRFHCRSSMHDRVLDFKTSSKNCTNYMKSGKGDCAGLSGEFSALADHTAKLPKVANGGFKDKGDYAMTEFPFFLAMQNHWGIHGLEKRWECDDYPNNESKDTLHQIFVR